LLIRQNNFALTEEEWQLVVSELQGDGDKVQALEALLESERLSFESPSRLLEEAKVLNEKIDDIAVSSMEHGEVRTNPTDVQKVVLVYTATSSAPMTIEEADVISRWIQERLVDDVVVTYFRPEPVAAAATASDTQ